MATYFACVNVEELWKSLLNYSYSDGCAKMKVLSTLVTQRSKGCQPDAKTHAGIKRGQQCWKDMGALRHVLFCIKAMWLPSYVLSESLGDRGSMWMWNTHRINVSPRNRACPLFKKGSRDCPLTDTVPPRSKCTCARSNGWLTTCTLSMCNKFEGISTSVTQRYRLQLPPRSRGTNVPLQEVMADCRYVPCVDVQ